MNESRKEARVAVSLVTRYREPTMLEPREGQCHDLSWSGMCIQTPKPSPRGALIRFECVTGAGTDDWIRGTGRVVWQRGKNDPRGAAGMGVRFVRLEPGSRDALERLVGPPHPRGSVQPPAPAPADSPAAAEAVSPAAAPAAAPPQAEERGSPGPGAQTLIIAPSSSGTGSTQPGMAAVRARAVHYPTLRGVGLSSRPPAAKPGEGGSSSAILPPASGRATHLELPPNSPLPPFSRSPSSPPEPTAAAEAESRRFDRTRRGMPSSASLESGAVRSDSDRPQRGDRPAEARRKSDRPPRPGGVDDLRASMASGAARSPDSDPAQGARPEGADSGRPMLEPNYGRWQGNDPRMLPPHLASDPDGQPRRDWMPWIMVGSGVAAALFMVSSFGSLPAFLRSGAAEPASPADIEPVSKPPAATKPPAAAAPQPQPTTKPAAAAPRFALEVSSEPAGARVSVGSRSVIAPGRLELEAAPDPIDVVAELSGYNPSRQQVRAAEFVTREGGLKVRALTFKLTPQKEGPAPAPPAPAPKPTPATTTPAPPPTRAAPAPAARSSSTPRAQSERPRPAASSPAPTPQIAAPPVPIGTPATPLESTPAAPPAPAMSVVPIESAATPPEPAKPDVPSPLERAMECLSRGDNPCVIDALEGRAGTERELGLLIETYLASGAAADAEREMKRYLQLYPGGQNAGKYQRALDKSKP